MGTDKAKKLEQREKTRKVSPQRKKRKRRKFDFWKKVKDLKKPISKPRSYLDHGINEYLKNKDEINIIVSKFKKKFSDNLLLYNLKQKRVESVDEKTGITKNVLVGYEYEPSEETKKRCPILNELTLKEKPLFTKEAKEVLANYAAWCLLKSIKRREELRMGVKPTEKFKIEDVDKIFQGY